MAVSNLHLSCSIPPVARSTTPIARTPTPIVKDSRKRPSSVVYYTNSSPVEKPQCINNDCPTRAAASGIPFICEDDVCMNELCGMVQNRGGDIGDCSDVTFREAENDKIRRVDAVKKQRVLNAGKTMAERATLEATSSAKTFHSRLDDLRSGKKAMRAAADVSVAHLLPFNLVHLLRASELADLEQKAKAEELWLDTQLFFAGTDAEHVQLCQSSKDRVIGDFFTGLNPSVSIIGENMSQSGIARPVRDREELRENVHTHFMCYIRHKKDELLAADKTYKAARKTALENQVYEIESVEDDGVTPVLDSRGNVVKLTLNYRDLVKAMDQMKGLHDRDDAVLARVMRTVFGWVTYALIFRDRRGIVDDFFGMDRWTQSFQCEAWHENALEILLRYRQLMHPLKPVHAHKELHCMHAIIIASWDTETPLTWQQVRPLFFGRSSDSKLYHWSETGTAQVKHDVIHNVRSTQLLVDLESMAQKLGIQPNWSKLVHHFAMHFEEKLRQTYGFKMAATEKSVLTLVDHVCRTVSRAQRNDAMRSTAAPAAASSSEVLPQSFTNFSPQVVAIACVRAIYAKHPFAVTPDMLANEAIAGTINVKILRKAHHKKRPRVSVTKDGQDSATIKAEAFTAMADVDGTQVTACVALLKPFLPAS